MRRAIMRVARPAATVAAALAAALAPAALRAQGTLSDQGFGYPPGQLSARALGMGGASGETDAVSPINPASLALWGRAGVFFQYQPEIREVSSGGNSDRTTTTRFPLVAAAIPFWGHTTLGVSASTFLDRTFSTQRTEQTTLSDGTVANLTSSFSSSGSANDVRLAGAWAPSPALALGAGIHVFTGENRVTVGVQLADTVGTGGVAFLPVNQERNLTFSGLGVSGGLMWRPIKALTFAASGRHGGTLRLSAGDTLLSKAKVPDRFGVGIDFDGIPGASLSARYDNEKWSSLNGLGSKDVSTFNAVEYSAGADVQGPRLGARTLLLRAGARSRTLPFGAEGSKVHETAFSGGLGVPLAAERVMMDLALQRAKRSASGVDASEQSWTIGVGFTVRP